MLVKLFRELYSASDVRVRKYCGREEASSHAAFPSGQSLRFEITVLHAMAADGVSMFIEKDGEERLEYHFEKNGDTFSLTLPPMCVGLYRYILCLWICGEAVYLNPYDNVNFTLGEESFGMFRLLIHSSDFHTPKWFWGGVMYQIFVDRFAKSGKSKLREDAVNEKDWYAPVSQFAKKPGDPLKNNLFYGGDLYGICEKLPYLSSLGVTVIYLNPIFRAYSNHKYDTGSFEEVDMAFGGDKALDELLKAANEYGIKIILDGVFNHTGDDSKYFNKYGTYPTLGAYKNPNSPWRDWYCFDPENEDEYSSWWGIKILPKLNQNNEACRQYFTGEGGICNSYIKKGCKGWRLDVADELPDSFLDELRASVKAHDPQAVIIGEVWENAADKVAYGNLRRYLQGGQLDSVMNYPFRSALIEFFKSGDGGFLARELVDIYSSYPKCVSHCLMNIIGTHDTDRILTVLGDGKYTSLDNTSLSVHTMSEEERTKAIKLLKIASLLQYTVYGVPSLYYGDEAGVEGGRDPFCRRTYPWGRECSELVDWYTMLGNLRKNKVYKDGDFKMLASGKGYVVFSRSKGGESLTTAVNISRRRIDIEISGTDIISGKEFNGVLAPMSAVVIK